MRERWLWRRAAARVAGDGEAGRGTQEQEDDSELASTRAGHLADRLDVAVFAERHIDIEDSPRGNGGVREQPGTAQ